MTTNKNQLAPCCGDPGLKQDTHLISVSNYFSFRQEVAQRVILITVVMSGGCFDAPRIYPRGLLVYSLSQSLINHRSPWLHTDFSRR